MITLFIDTSDSDVSIALIKNNKILSSITKNIPNEHSIYTTKYIDDIIKSANLTPKDINKIMVVNGPGSFTGVRIGVTIAKVFAYLLNIDIICVSSLKMRAISTKHDYCLAIIDAKNDNYYFGLYDKNNKEIIPEQFNTKLEIEKLIKKYNPQIISNKEIYFNSTKIEKVNLDIPQIVEYYQNTKPVNCHLALPNYLKLPQAMEKKS